MKNFDWDEFINGDNSVVHCRTIEEARDFCNLMYEHDLRWANGRSYFSETNYDVHAEETCYTNNGYICNLEHSNDMGYEVLEWSDYMKSEAKGNDTNISDEIKPLATETDNVVFNSMFEIKRYKVDKKKKAVVVFFSDGDVQKAICQKEDKFDIETGIEICAIKHVMGKATYHKVVREALKQVKALDKVVEDKKKADELLAKKKAKEQAKKAKRAEKKRQQRVAEMKEAYLSALKEYNGNISVESLATQK